MAQENRMMTDELPLIEEHVETGLRALLDGYRSAYNPSGEKKNELYARFTILPDERLESLDHPYAKAYRAIDDNSKQRSVYAMVCEKSLPYRDAAIQGMVGVNQTSITPLLGAGVVYCTAVNESRYVLFLERPHGIKLSDSLLGKPRLHEHRVVDHVIQPVFKALQALREKKISHGNIHTGSIYASDTSVVTECYSAPCGSLTHYLYHPLERLMCGPLAFGEANEKTDIFALGILAYELMFGLDKIKTVPKEDYLRMVMTFGTYPLLTNNKTLSEALQDFFRGALNDNPIERWGIDQLEQWLNGKRFNMVVPMLPKDGARPLAFIGEDFTNRRLLAHAFHRNWREATKDIRGLKIDRWCESSLHRPELAEKMERALRIAGDAATDKQMSDMMTRIIAILDPTNPMRSMALSIRPDSIGILLAEMMSREAPPELYQLIDMIDTDVSSYWAGLSEANKFGDMAQTLWRLSRAKQYLKKKSFGFGLERVLYELNPSLPCRMRLLDPYHVTTAQDLLKTLDALAPTVGGGVSFLDRHLAAFLACKTDMGKEIRIGDLVGVRQFERHEELVVLKILAKVQQKYDLFPLVGLCGWAAMRIELMLDDVHNRVLRKNLKLQLRKLASSGKLNDVLAVILDRNITQRDVQGFTQAIALHQINYKKIARFENPRLIDYYAREAGGKVAAMISYIILFITSLIVFFDATGL